MLVQKDIYDTETPWQRQQGQHSALDCTHSEKLPAAFGMYCVLRPGVNERMHILGILRALDVYHGDNMVVKI